MTNGLLVYLRLIFTPSTAGKLTFALNEKAAPVQKALDALLPAVVGGVLHQVSSPQGRATLYQLLTTTPFDAELPVSQLIDTDAHRKKAAESGINCLHQLYGQQTYQLIGSVAQYSRVNIGSAITLTGLVTWVLLENLQQQLIARSLTQAQLTTLLEDEVEPVGRALPADLAGSLGWFLGSTPGKPVARTRLALQPTGKPVAGLPWLRWLVYLVASVLVLVFLPRACAEQR